MNGGVFFIFKSLVPWRHEQGTVPSTFVDCRVQQPSKAFLHFHGGSNTLNRNCWPVVGDKIFARIQNYSKWEPIIIVHSLVMPINWFQSTLKANVEMHLDVFSTNFSLPSGQSSDQQLVWTTELWWLKSFEVVDYLELSWRHQISTMFGKSLLSKIEFAGLKIDHSGQRRICCIGRIWQFSNVLETPKTPGLGWERDSNLNTNRSTRWVTPLQLAI